MDKKVLRWNFVFQYGWVLTNIFNSILLLPLYIKNIDATTLGIWLATSSILAWMTLVDPGIGEVLQQKIAELRGRAENTEIGKSIGSGFIASAIILLISVVVGFACYFFVGIIINKDVTQYPHLAMALVISIVATGMSLVSFTMSGINQGLHNSAQVAIASLSANFLFLIVNLLLLYAGFGVMSIAIANLCRALFINIYNIASMLHLLKKQQMAIMFSRVHFKKFIRIFSFTSASKIISGLSYSMDMVVLARFIAPEMITVYEINKRPITITNSLIGRHSVALMPLISHAKGRGDKEAIINLVNKQLKIYSYAALFVSFLFCFNYESLITLWTGKGNYAGDVIVYLLVIFSFVALICYFMSNVGYALGDIKMNSLFNIMRNLFYGVCIFFAARYYGIIGTLAVSLGLALVADFFYFAYRVYRLGYLTFSFIKHITGLWLIIIPAGYTAGFTCTMLVEKVIPAGMHFSRLLVNSALFTMLFIILLLVVDSELQAYLRRLKNKFMLSPFYKMIRAN